MDEKANKHSKPADWPEGGFGIISVDSDYEVSNLICEECNGVRNKITHVFRVNDFLFDVHGEQMNLQELSRRLPETGANLHRFFHVGEFVNPTCTACQEDFHMRAKRLFVSEE